MKSVSVDEERLDKAMSAGVLGTFARSAFFRTLTNVKVGHLCIEEEGALYCFGQPREQASLVAHVLVERPWAYRYFVFGGSIGSGEAYMQGAWHSPDLTQVIRLMAANMAVVEQMDSGWSFTRSLAASLFHRFHSNSKSGSRRNIAAHYDLGNDFFSLFLDPNMLYSAAIYPDEHTSLHQASIHKLRHICQRLQLHSSDHLLEIGTGWGGMAIFAAKHYGCRVTTTTLSLAQYDFAREWVRREGLEARVTVLLKDYRELAGQYDKLVSIEMIEAVGHKFYPQYFAICNRLLTPSGLMLLQAITISDQRYTAASGSADFIQRYIFPGGSLPSLGVIGQHVAKHSDMQLVGLQDITLHYARTLAHWREAFTARLEDVKAQGFDETFIKMWEFYLCYCEGGFRERVIGTSQLLLAKPACRQLPAIT